MKNLWRDIRYALRQLRHSPGFTVTAVLTLAFGIGANSTILSWISGTLLNSVHGGARTADMVTIMRGERSEHPTPPFSYPDFVDLRAQAKSFTGMLAYHNDFVSITGTAVPERIYGDLVTANYFEVLGVHPILGGSLLSTRSNEAGTNPVAVLGYGLWQSHFGGDPNIVGKTIDINLHRYTIVGVAPRGFTGCATGVRSDIFLPIGDMAAVWSFNRLQDRSVSFLNVLAVLRPGVSLRHAQSEVSLIMQRIVARYPDLHLGNNQISLDPLWRSPFGANVYLAGTLTMLMALAGVLLLLACANVANLLLVRSISRRREIAIRLSVGADRRQLFRQLMVENLLLAAGGCGAALAVTSWSAHTLAFFIPAIDLPLDINGRMDGRVLLATIAVSVLTAVIAGVGPALRASALAPVEILKEETLSSSGSARKSRLTSSLVVLQVALSLVLLACAGLFVRSLEKASAIDPGFDPHHVLLASFDLSPLGYSDARGAEFYRQLLAKVRATPGVQSATIADFAPLNFTIHSDGILPEGYVLKVHESVEADRGSVMPGYLETLGTRLIAGREFAASDTAASQPVAMVNQALADRYWPGETALGKHILVGRTRTTVVGVIGNAKYRRLVYGAAPLVLMPLMQRYQDQVILEVRTAGDPMAMSAAITRVVHGLNPDLPLYNLTSLESSMKMGSVFERLAVTFASSFGLLAMLLAAVGLYGVVAYTTRQRTHEIGIRMALGAGRGDVFRQVLRQGLVLTGAGVAVGLIAALALTRFLGSLLYGVGATDWITFAVVAVGLCAVGVAACVLPARRAASTQPMQALRTE